MKSVKDQILDRCIFFNGIMNDQCNAKVKYSDVRVGKPYKFPCLKQGGVCEISKFPTLEDAEKEVKEIKEMTEIGSSMYSLVKQHYNNTKELFGIIKCECGGDLKYSISQVNYHIWANCNKCGISLKE